MQIASLVLGILAISGMVVGFFPCVGWFNWFNIPFALIGLVISIIALSTAKPGESKTQSVIGAILCGGAVVLGGIRLILGAGLF